MLPNYAENRFKDIMVPLFTIAHVTEAPRSDLVNLCEWLADMRTDDSQQNDAVKLIQIFLRNLPAQEEVLRLHSETIVAELKRLGVYRDEKIGLPRLLRQLRIKTDKGTPTKQVRIGWVSRKGVEITRKQVEELARRYKVEVSG